MDEWMKRCRGEIDRLLIDWIGLLFHEVRLTADRGMQKRRAIDRSVGSECARSIVIEI